jgi:thymidylate kinase
MPKLICITGIDGAGKNTLIGLLINKLESVTVACIWDILNGDNSKVPFKSKKEIDNYLCGLSPNSRLLFLAHALKFSIDRALKSDKEFVILNAYIYKYFATELALGADKALVYFLIKNFPTPDKTFFIDVDIKEAANRKRDFSRYECGTSNTSNENDFLKFQSHSINFWNTFDKNNWIKLNGIDTPENLVHIIINTLNLK